MIVLEPGWTVVATNALGTARMGDQSGRPERERNVAWRTFAGAPSRVVHTPEQQAAFEADVVADLHAAVGRYPDDEGLHALVAELRAASPRFADLWASGPIRVRVSSRKTIVHPDVGRITVDCDVLRASDSDLRLVVYTAAPGSPDAQAIALLGALGLQSFAAIG